MSETKDALALEMVIAIALLWMIGVLALIKSALYTAMVLCCVLLVLFIGSALDLKQNGFPSRLAIYGIPGRILFVGVLWASYRSHRNGRLQWKGRAYPVDTPRASKG